MMGFILNFLILLVMYIRYVEFITQLYLLVIYLELNVILMKINLY